MSREFAELYQCVHESAVSVDIASLYGGSGTIEVSRLFRSEGILTPILLPVYRIPRGACEGVHAHHHGDDNRGAFDEIYYVVSGQGHMIIDGRRVPVATGAAHLMPVIRDYPITPARAPVVDTQDDKHAENDRDQFSCRLLYSCPPQSQASQ